jgi:DNA/RNA-binding domain of Phe-tRNA-synthetase-like protein
MHLRLDAGLRSKFPGLGALVIRIHGVSVKRTDAGLESFKEEVSERVRGRWTLDDLREHPTFRAYRDFFWRVSVDPTKTRPASEALIRRVLRGRPIPRINTLVDSYNLASMESAIPLAAFDEDELAGEPLMREARGGEEFLGIAMERPVVLNGGEAVVEDGEKLIAIYPHRDAEESKVKEDTEKTLMLVCGVPNIGEEDLVKAGRIAVEYITRFCGGREA